jgi:hypothetical protein
MKQIPFKDTKVKEVFSAYPNKYKNKLLFLRHLIFEIAKKTENVGEIEETLKWGEPSYISKNGSTIRINWKKKLGNSYAIYFKCTSLLVPTFKKLYPHEFEYEGNRAIHFSLDDKIPIKKLSLCIKMALTYHLIKKNLNSQEKVKETQSKT